MNTSDFHALTRPFVGLELSRPWRGYGSALFAEVGPLTQIYKRTKHPKAERGLDFGSSWRIESVRGILFGSSSGDDRISHGVASLTGLTIKSVSLQGRLPELHIQLSGGRWLSTFATSESQPEWSVFLPDGSWLVVRRGALVRETSKGTVRNGCIT